MVGGRMPEWEANPIDVLRARHYEPHSFQLRHP